MKKHYLYSISFGIVVSMLFLFQPESSVQLLLSFPIGILGGLIGGSIGGFLDQKFPQSQKIYLAVSMLLGITFSWLLIPVFSLLLTLNR